MLPLLAEIADRPGAEARSAVRRTLRLSVAVTSADAAQALIHNLSERGLLLETTAALPIGEILGVELPEVGSAMAVVVWARGNFAGCEFSSPVPQAAVSAALLRSPPERQPVLASSVVPVVASEWKHSAFKDEEEDYSQVALIIALMVSLLVVAVFILALLAFPLAS